MLKDSKRPLFTNLLAAGDVEEGQATGQLGFDDIDRATFLRECGDRLHTWRMLYCGGAKPVSDALTAISKDLGISFRKESFAWLSDYHRAHGSSLAQDCAPAHVTCTLHLNPPPLRHNLLAI